MQETCVLSLGWEDPPQKEMAAYSSILAWRIPWTEDHCGLQSMGLQESDRTEQITLSVHSDHYCYYYFFFFFQEAKVIP